MTEMKAKMMTLEAPEFPFSLDTAKVYSYTEKPSMKEVQKLEGGLLHMGPQRKYHIRLNKKGKTQSHHKP